MRLVFLGSGDFGLPTLQHLLTSHEVCLVVTQPSRPAGRKRKLTATPVGAFSADHELNVATPDDVNTPEAVAQVLGREPDALVVIAYGQKLGSSLLAERFAINLHASLLPKYRGAAPINWAMINGELQTGISVIRMSDRIDAGAVLGQRAITIDPMETAGELEQRLAGLGPELIDDVLAAYARDEVVELPQEEGAASRAPKLAKSDGTLTFDQPAASVRARVHGLTPWPGCHVQIDGKRLRLVRIDVCDALVERASPGELLADGSIACLSGAVRLLSVQPPGGKAMSFEAFRRGHEISVGTRLEPV